MTCRFRMNPRIPTPSTLHPTPYIPRPKSPAPFIPCALNPLHPKFPQPQVTCTLTPSSRPPAQVAFPAFLSHAECAALRGLAAACDDFALPSLQYGAVGRLAEYRCGRRGCKARAPGGKPWAPGGETWAPGGKTRAPGGKTRAPGGKPWAPGRKTARGCLCWHLTRISKKSACAVLAC